MAKLALVHWNDAEARARATRLAAMGHEVSYHADTKDPSGLKRWVASPPEAFVFDLSRLPSHSRDIALSFRDRKATRGVPVIFVGGEPEKVARTRSILPDATYASWTGFRGALRTALHRPPANPVAPGTLAGYSGTPLPKKLGLKEGSSLALVGAPDGFESVLGALPPGVRLARRVSKQADVTLLFARSRKELTKRFPAARAALGERARLWICWPKQASGLALDLGEREVRATGLDSGIVDFKIAAIDATWSGLCFTHRR